MEHSGEVASVPTGSKPPSAPCESHPDVQSKNSNSWADRVESELYTRFFIIKGKEKSLLGMSPFLIHKTIQAMVGDVIKVNMSRSGELLIEVANAAQSLKIKKVSTIGTTSVSVSAHASLNTSRGVISEYDLLHTPEEEILENLKLENVCNVRRITLRRNGEIIPTKHIILTFSQPKLPSHISAGYLKCSVRPYIPNPLRCFKCQRFGHSQNNCRGTETCARCSSKDHRSEDCSGPFKCVNCEGNHPSYSRTCKKFITEREIQTVKINQNVSYPEARRIVEARTPRPGISYSAAITTKKPTCSKCTQTEIIEIPSITPSQQIPPSRIIASTSETGKFIPVSKRRNSKKPKPPTPAVSSESNKTSKKKRIAKPLTDPVTPSTSNKFAPLKNFFLKDTKTNNDVIEPILELSASDLSEMDEDCSSEADGQSQ